MDNLITQILLAVLIAIILGKPLFEQFRAKERDLGGATLISHIFNTVKTKGFIEIKIGEDKITLVEKAVGKKEKHARTP